MILTLLHHTTHIYLHTTTGNNCEATQKQRVVSNKMARDKAEHYGMCVYVCMYVYMCVCVVEFRWLPEISINTPTTSWWIEFTVWIMRVSIQYTNTN